MGLDGEDLGTQQRAVHIEHAIPRNPAVVPEVFHVQAARLHPDGGGHVRAESRAEQRPEQDEPAVDEDVDPEQLE